MQRAAKSPIQFDLGLPSLELEFGSTVDPHVVRGWMWGTEDDHAVVAPAIVDGGPTRVIRRTLSDEATAVKLDGALSDDRPTVVVVHALTGDSYAGGRGGWWSGVIGRGRALDPDQYRLICFNNLGSCYGTSGPGDEGFPLLDSPENAPAPITTWDQARSILLALEKLGIDRVHTVIGGSVGGMVSLCLSVLEPQMFERVIPIASNEAAGPWIIGWNHIARRLVLSDPDWPDSARSGVSLAREIAMMTYRAERGMVERHGRRRSTVSQVAERERAGFGYSQQEPYAVQTYLDYQGEKLESRFVASAYLSQLDAMDHHDISRRPSWMPPPENEREDTEDAAEYYPHDASRSWGLMRIEASMLAVGIDSDMLFLPRHMRNLVRRVSSLGKIAEYREIESDHGHDAFLLEADQVNDIIETGLALPRAED